MTMSTTVLATAAAAARIALAEATMLKVGQVLQAIVAATDSDGITTLTLGDQTVETQLPQPLPVGTTLQLQVKAGGATPQLAIVSQSPPAAQALAAAPAPRPIALAAMPAPQAAAPLVLALQAGPATAPEVFAAAPMAEMNSPAGAAREAAPPATAIVESPQALALTSSQSGSAVAPAPPLSGGREEVPSAAPPAGAPAMATGPTATLEVAVAALDTSPPIPVTSLPAAGVPPMAAPAAAAEQGGHPVPVSTSSPTEPSPTGLLSVSPQPALQRVVALSTPVAIASDVAPADAVGASVVAASSPAVVTNGPAPGMVSVAEAAPELQATNPLLLAQSAARPVIAAEVPQAFVASPAAAVPAGRAAPLPQTPEAALVQMMPEAIARQASAGPLLHTLAEAVQRPDALPEPVLRAAAVVLAQRIVTADGRVSAQTIEQAVTRSGIGLEASLARGAPQPMDAKAGLLALRDALGKWLGDSPAAAIPQPRVQGDAPPLRGLPLRASPADLPPLPDAARDIGRLLHQETDGAVSRVKLMQLASLPDAAGSASRPGSPTLRLELPFLIGHELVMAQMQIGRDGHGRRDAAGKRGWTMRFALNFSATGEVGAEVGLLGKAVTVSLWAAEPETAAAMRETLPELAGALEAVGLAPQGIRIRGGAPESEAPASGQLLDNVS